jgi:hypothetical protein
MIHLCPIRGCSAKTVTAILVGLTAAGTAWADLVVRRDNSRVEGEVVSVDATSVVVRSGTNQLRLNRSEVASIVFDAKEAPPPPLKVELRNVQADDAVSVFLEGEPVLADASGQGEWIDLTPKLKNGNNALRLSIRNDRGGWAYRLSLRINGKLTSLACGIPHRNDAPCRCCGKTGNEIGTIDDLPPVWIHVDQGFGRAEVLP